MLCPQLHELRAKEVLVVARAFSVERLPDPAFEVWAEADSASEAASASAASAWRERALELCLESLRRHESFLDSSWVSLLPFKPPSAIAYLELRVLSIEWLGGWLGGVLLVPI